MVLPYIRRRNVLCELLVKGVRLVHGEQCVVEEATSTSDGKLAGIGSQEKNNKESVWPRVRGTRAKPVA